MDKVPMTSLSLGSQIQLVQVMLTFPSALATLRFLYSMLKLGNFSIPKLENYSKFTIGSLAMNQKQVLNPRLENSRMISIME
jgi:hypothetical protein